MHEFVKWELRIHNALILRASVISELQMSRAFCTMPFEIEMAGAAEPRLLPPRRGGPSDFDLVAFEGDGANGREGHRNKNRLASLPA